MVPWLVSLLCVGCAAWLALVGQRTVAQPRGAMVLGLGCALFFVLHGRSVGAGAENLATLLAWASVGLMLFVGLCIGQEQAGAAGPMRQDVTQRDVELWSMGQAVALPGLARTWLVVALVSVAMALCQYLRVEHWFAPWISVSGDGTAYANLRQRNQFATLCGMGLLALLYLRQLSAGREGMGYWPWLAAGALALGNALSSSRTGALQWLLIGALVWLWRGSLSAQVKRLAWGSMLIYAVAVALMPWFADVVGNTSSGVLSRMQDSTGSGRVALYSNVIELIAQKPWLGWGWRELAYAHYATSFGTQEGVRFMDLLDNAHNLPLHLAVELGLPFALLFCGTLAWWVWRAAPWREADAARQLAWGVLALLALHSMVEYPLWYGPFLMTLGLCLGLLLAPAAAAAPSGKGFYIQNRAAGQWNIAGAAIKSIAIGLLCFTLYAAFDYHRVSQIYLPVEQRSARYEGDVMAAAQRSWLFRRQAQFAELVTTPLTPQTAVHVLRLSLDLVHYSPEPRVIEALIESATMLHFDDVAMAHLARYKEAYPKDYAAWSALK